MNLYDQLQVEFVSRMAIVLLAAIWFGLWMSGGKRWYVRLGYVVSSVILFTALQFVE